MSRLPSLLAPIGLCLLLALGGCTETPSPPREIMFRVDGYLEFLRPDGSIIERIAIEVAEGDSAQARGLMDRTDLHPRAGMLFVDDEATMRSFWMKNTPLPLDIIFIAEDSSVVNVVRRTIPFSADLINSTDSARFVLEVRAGVADRIGITDGMPLRWTLQ